MQKTEAQQAEVLMRDMNKLIRDLDSWLSNVKKKLQHANNDEEQLQVIIQFRKFSVFLLGKYSIVLFRKYPMKNLILCLLEAQPPSLFLERSIQGCFQSLIL